MKVLIIILSVLYILALVGGILLFGYFIAWLITPECLWDDRGAGGGI